MSLTITTSLLCYKRRELYVRGRYCFNLNVPRIMTVICMDVSNCGVLFMRCFEVATKLLLKTLPCSRYYSINMHITLGADSLYWFNARLPRGGPKAQPALCRLVKKHQYQRRPTLRLIIVRHEYKIVSFQQTHT